MKKEIYVSTSGHLVIKGRSFGPDMDEAPVCRQLFRAFPDREDRREVWKAYAAYRGHYDPSKNVMVSKAGYEVPVKNNVAETPEVDMQKTRRRIEDLLGKNPEAVLLAGRVLGVAVATKNE